MYDIIEKYKSFSITNSYKAYCNDINYVYYAFSSRREHGGKWTGYFLLSRTELDMIFCGNPTKEYNDIYFDSIEAVKKRIDKVIAYLTKIEILYL